MNDIPIFSITFRHVYFIFIIFVCLLFVENVQATIIHVPADMETIQAGIDIATDGDTVLVQPGTYVENINFNGKKIVVGSLFLTTGDGSYISQTVIHGNSSGSVVRFENGEDATTVLAGVKLKTGKAEFGGGIYCRDSSPGLIHVMIVGNKSENGGGIFCDNSSPILTNLIIMGNEASSGGGVFLKNNSKPNLSAITISNNTAAINGGGIFIHNSIPIFNDQKCCHIYSNAATIGIDLYADNSPTIAVIVDTFTVMLPKDYHASPIGNFTFNILHAKVEQVSMDLYVNPKGDNDNSGLSESEPLKTIGSAFSRIWADSLNPHTIHLAEGRYSRFTGNGELFPLNMQSYVSLSGQSKDNVILHAEGKNIVVLNFDHDDGITIENMTIRGVGSDRLRTPRSAVFCDRSNPRFVNVIVKENDGDGIECHNACPTLIDVLVSNNNECGIRCIYNSNPILMNVIISRNSEVGIECHLNSSPNLTNVTIRENSGGFGGGIYCTEHSYPILSNVTITGNTAAYGGGICCDNSSPLFNDQNRCNIYFNFAGKGNDLYAIHSPIIAIAVDTFTVMNPTNFNAYPIQNFTFDIKHAKLDQVSADLYVSPAGNNTNSGLSSDDPMQTVSIAMLKILADSLNPHIIHLANGIYSSTTTNENFPLHTINHVSFSGESQDDVILDAEQKSDIMVFDRIDNVSVNNLTITGGSWFSIYCNYSSPHFANVTIKDNQKWGIYCNRSSPDFKDVIIEENKDCGFWCRFSSPHFDKVTISHNSGRGIDCHKSSLSLTNGIINGNKGGGIYLSYSDDVNISNIVISNNSADGGGAGIYCYFSNPRLVNTIISENVTVTKGGGVYCYASSPVLKNVTIIKNKAAEKGGGMFCEYSLNLNLLNVTLSGNTTQQGGGIFCNWPSNLYIINSIFWNDSRGEIVVGNAVTIAHSDIQGGKSSIVNNNNGKVNWLAGSINVDPLFADSVHFYLSHNSPCTHAGIQDTFLVYNNGQDTLFVPPMDYLGAAPDMGAHESEFSIDVDEKTDQLPTETILFQNYPNPFNPVTVIRYQLSAFSKVELSIYNIAGQKVVSLVSEQQQAGVYKYEWDASNLSSGVYFYRLTSTASGGNRIQMKKLVLLK